jgi:hypothetical protein
MMRGTLWWMLVRATEDALNASLEQMQIVEEMRRTLRNKGREQARLQLAAESRVHNRTASAGSDHT